MESCIKIVKTCAKYYNVAHGQIISGMLIYVLPSSI